jgi:hypothetical protein
MQIGSSVEERAREHVTGSAKFFLSQAQEKQYI